MKLDKNTRVSYDAEQKVCTMILESLQQIKYGKRLMIEGENENKE